MQSEGLSHQPQEWRHQHRQDKPLPGTGCQQMSQIELARNLDQIAVQSADLRQQATVSTEQLGPFLELVGAALDGLQAENTRLFKQLSNIKTGLIGAVEQFNA